MSETAVSSPGTQSLKTNSTAQAPIQVNGGRGLVMRTAFWPWPQLRANPSQKSGRSSILFHSFSWAEGTPVLQELASV
jgi:hypothetical protein